MSKEDRVYFESELLKELKDLEWPGLSIKAVKGGVKFRWEKKLVAELDFQHLVNSNAYVLNGMVFGGAIFDCCSEVSPPYKSNLGSAACFSFTTSGRQDKKFGTSIYGTISVPKREDVGAICARIRRALESHYIPLMAGCILPSARTIDDVLASPTGYAYPALFIHCAVAYNSEIISSENLEKVKLNKKIIKNKDFDLGLLSGL